MSGEEEHEFHAFGLPVPKELIEHFMEHKARHEMAAEEQLHTLIRAFQEMDLDHLRAVKGLVSNIDGGHDVGFWEGIILMHLAQRTGKCVACGKNHDEEAAKLLSAEAGGALD